MINKIKYLIHLKSSSKMINKIKYLIHLKSNSNRNTIND